MEDHEAESLSKAFVSRKASVDEVYAPYRLSVNEALVSLQAALKISENVWKRPESPSENVF